MSTTGGRRSGPLWTPSAERAAGSELRAFMAKAASDSGVAFADYASLHRWSIERPDQFWSSLWDFCGVVGERGPRSIDGPERMPGARFFPDGRLDFTQNLLGGPDDADAIVFWGEDRVRRRLSWAELRALVARMARALAASGVGPGDRVAGILPNLPEAVAAMLATAHLGAIWSSCSPDFGVAGVLDRFAQIGPKLLFVADVAYYNGVAHPQHEKLPAILEGLPSVETVVVVPYLASEAVPITIRKAVALAEFLAPHAEGPLEPAPRGFNEPLVILYSSGTTGPPKCIVHGRGGTLLKHLSEHRLHCDIKPGDRVFYFTTCGWMMWNWLASALASRATLLLYDGSPFHPDADVLWDFAEAERATFFGTSAKYIDALRKAGRRPGATHDLSALRTLASTGSPLSAEGFAFVYEAVKRDLHLASISGGTDIVGCFVLGVPTEPVYAGEIQAPALGVEVQVFNDAGHSLVGARGELVCTRPFPSMPLGFWNDPDGARYRAAYFAHFPGVWRHGDWIEQTAHGGYVIHGRSDATLKPGGVRIGTAELYRQVERIEEVEEALAVGQDWEGDVRIVLFVRLREGLRLDAALIDRIKEQVRLGCSPRHVPAKVIQVRDIPRTKSGKITELAVRDVIHGRPVSNLEALANPDALVDFRDRPQLREG